MSPKEELIQVIKQSPDELVQAMLELLKVMQLRIKADGSQQKEPVFNSVYPLRGLPLIVAEDFDESISH